MSTNQALRHFVRLKASNPNAREMNVKSGVMLVINKFENPSKFPFFDKTFDTHVDQEEVYLETMKGFADRLLDGYNASMIVIGPPNSGKNYTYFGPKDNFFSFDHAGLVPRFCDGLFNHLLQCDKSACLRMSHVLIHEERAFDLQSDCDDCLEVAKDEKLNQYVIYNLVIAKVDSPKELEDRLTRSVEKKRLLGYTINEKFSHEIFKLYVTVTTPIEDDELQVTSQMTFVKLTDLFKGPAFVDSTMQTLEKMIMYANRTPMAFDHSVVTKLLYPILRGNTYVSVILTFDASSTDCEQTAKAIDFFYNFTYLKFTPKTNHKMSKVFLEQFYDGIIKELLRSLNEAVCLKGNIILTDDSYQEIKKSGKFDLCFLEDRFDLVKKLQNIVYFYQNLREILLDNSNHCRTWLVSYRQYIHDAYPNIFILGPEPAAEEPSGINPIVGDFADIQINDFPPEQNPGAQLPVVEEEPAPADDDEETLSEGEVN